MPGQRDLQIHSSQNGEATGFVQARQRRPDAVFQLGKMKKNPEMNQRLEKKPPTKKPN